jgi:phenylacetate-CoA ligase
VKALTGIEVATGAVQAAVRSVAVARHGEADDVATQREVLRRLRRIVDHAFENVPFYRERFASVGYTKGSLRVSGDLAHLPITTKAEIRDLPVEDLTSRTVPPKRRLPSITSGASGEVLTVWHDARRLGELGLAMLRVTRLVTPHRPWHRLLYVYTSRFPVASVFGLYPMHFVPTTADPRQIESEWQRIRPDVVWIYPSRLRDLILAGCDLPPAQLISVGSELSTAQERLAWEAKLRSTVRDQYGTEELGLVAAECGHRNRHILSDLCHVEILAPDGTAARGGEVGDLIGTNLENLAMPFIRYRQGDRAAVAASACPCGRTLPVLDPIEGRERIDLVGPTGERVGSGVVIDALYGLVLELGLPVSGYRLVSGKQPTLLLSGPLSDGQAETAANFIRSRTGLVVRPVLVSRLPDLGDGKRELVVPPAQSPTARK